MRSTIDHRFATVATWIDPAVKLDAGEEPRVSGRITYASVVVDGLRTLRVTSNFVWVYAFDRADRPLAVAHDELRWELPSTAGLRAGDRGRWLGDRKSYPALVDCAASDRGPLAPTRVGGTPRPACNTGTCRASRVTTHPHATPPTPTRRAAPPTPTRRSARRDSAGIRPALTRSMPRPRRPASQILWSCRSVRTASPQDRVWPSCRHRA
ncbi:hypothetical protein [Paractinoplanes toevensis]|uniref:Uncharacterized protein n=1 Tax=Paractinoplanes toevensis TaxID=571911 RepID=A0A919T4Z3_9ACTN|nr:hypothetical protein [Actinoplanes toevensis]GIM89145.1 hypothetical protein Ato02nite_009380 [Actinoplanes toevensis]